jgi:predicted nucleic acid-binding protein
VNVLVDSDVWSDALRRQSQAISTEVQTLRDLILEDRVQLIGPVRQEILSGIREGVRYERFRQTLRGFTERPIERQRFEEAAAHFNLCRSHGIQGSSTDFLLCACSIAWNQPILTKDQDFRRYRQFIPIQLLLETPA